MLTLANANTYTGATHGHAGTLRLGTNPSIPSRRGVWIDASDAASLTVSNGYVSQWNDKSGSGRHLTQGTAANQPSYGPLSMNGYSTVRFDGNDVIGNNFAFAIRTRSSPPRGWPGTRTTG